MRSLTKINEKLDDIKTQLDKAIEEVKNGGFKDVFMEYFEKNQDIQAVAFVGYIPGFNDGDPCVFGLGEVNFATFDADLSADIPEWECYGDEHPGWLEISPAAPRYWSGSWKENPDYDEDAVAIVKFIYNNEEVMNELFGDNFKVVITREGIHVYDFDCGY